MGNWKTKLCAGDLGDEDRIELECRKCGQVRYLTKVELLERDAEHLYLDEIEKRAKCKVFGCAGQMRLALVRQHKMSAFVGGLA